MDNTVLQQIIINLLSIAGSVILSFITAKLTARREIRKWKREDDVSTRKANAKVISEVSKWLQQTYNLHQKQEAIAAVSSALTFAAGEHADILMHLRSEITKDAPREQVIRTLIDKYARLKLKP